MSRTAIEELLGRVSSTEQPEPAAQPASAPAQAQDEDAEPDHYRPYVIRGPRPAFSVVEGNGKRHGFAYFGLRHPVYEVQQGREFLSFLADGCEVVMEGKGLLPVYHALLRHTLWELRAYDGKQPVEINQPGMITRLEVAEPQERLGRMQQQGRA